MNGLPTYTITTGTVARLSAEEEAIWFLKYAYFWLIHTHSQRIRRVARRKGAKRKQCRS